MHGSKKLQIWPIVQLADWGEPVAVDQVATVSAKFVEDCGNRSGELGLSIAG